jgi:hypothetical protein
MHSFIVSVQQLYFGGFEPRKILSPRGFCPLFMPSIMVNIQIELVTCLGDFVPRRILSSAYALNLGPCLSYYSNWKILSSGGFYPREDFIQKNSIPFHISFREDFWLEDILTAKKIWIKRKIVLGKISFSGKILDYWNIFSIGVLKVKGVFCDKGWLCHNVDIFLVEEFDPWKNCLWEEILHQRKNL